MNHQSLAMNLFSSHGALMDPEYLRRTQNSYESEGKAPAVRRAALAIAVAIPAVIWVASQLSRF
jgi:hypothetical protein